MPSDLESLASSVSHTVPDPEPIGHASAASDSDAGSLASSDSDHAGKSRLPAPLPLPVPLALAPTALNRSKNPCKVPTAERRGFLARLCVLPEYVDARTYPKRLKLTIVFVVAFAAVAGPMGTSILLPAVTDLSQDLHTLVLGVNVLVGVYLISLGVFPMWWLNFSERHGRRSVYVVSFSWFFAFSIACAVAPSIVSLVILRFLAGAGASAVQACGAGTISDLYVQEERGVALGLFYLGPLFGPFLAPILGGAVAVAWGWRATMWIMVIVCGLNVLLIILFLPETLPRNDLDMVRARVQEKFADELPEKDLERMATNLSHNLSLRRTVLDDETPVDAIMPTLLHVTTGTTPSKRVLNYDVDLADTHPRGYRAMAYDYAVRPMHATVFFLYPPVLLVIMYSGITFMGIYLLNITISNRYSEAPYLFSPIIVGLMYVPNSVTYIFASIYGGRWNDWLIRRYAALHDGEKQPEARLSWNIVLAAGIYPCASLIFGWCLDKNEHWVTPLIGSALFGFASMLVIGATVTYLIDVMPGKGATGVALNNLFRMLLAATATFVTEPLILALGTGVLFSIYAGVVSVASMILLYLKIRGAQMRERHDIFEYYARL